MASSRIEDVPSQSFIDGANSSHRPEEVETGALWKIQRSTLEGTKADRQWSTFNLQAAPQLSPAVRKSIQFHHHSPNPLSQKH